MRHLRRLDQQESCKLPRRSSFIRQSGALVACAAEGCCCFRGLQKVHGRHPARALRTIGVTCTACSGIIGSRSATGSVAGRKPRR